MRVTLDVVQNADPVPTQTSCDVDSFAYATGFTMSFHTSLVGRGNACHWIRTV